MRIKHKKDYPDYKYQPRKRKTSKQNSEEGDEKIKSSQKIKVAKISSDKSDHVERSEKDKSKPYAYKNKFCSYAARSPSVEYNVDKSHTHLGYFYSSSEANAMQRNNNIISNGYNANQVYENNELGNYPDMETFVPVSHVSPQLSNLSPQNCSPKPQQNQSDMNN